MRKVIALAFLAIFMFMTSSLLAFADDEADEENEQEGQSEDNENENRIPGFEAALAITCSLGAVRLLRKAS